MGPDPAWAYFWSALNKKLTCHLPRYFLTGPDEIYPDPSLAQTCLMLTTGMIYVVLMPPDKHCKTCRYTKSCHVLLPLFLPTFAGTAASVPWCEGRQSCKCHHFRPVSKIPHSKISKLPQLLMWGSAFFNIQKIHIFLIFSFGLDTRPSDIYRKSGCQAGREFERISLLDGQQQPLTRTFTLTSFALVLSSGSGGFQ